MIYTRRNLIKHSGAAAAGVSVLGSMPRPAMALLGDRPEPAPPIQDPRLKELISVALSEAQSAGASYADARLTFNDNLSSGGGREQAMSFGVRALVDGYWGFAASPIWSNPEAARLGRSAVDQARVNLLGKAREVDLAPIITADSGGHWTMPVKDDPFEINFHEIEDYVLALQLFIARLRTPQTTNRMIRVAAQFLRQDKALGTTSGHYSTQRLYRTSGGIDFFISNVVNGTGSSVFIDRLTAAGAGFEYLRDQPLREIIREEFEKTLEEMKLPVTAVNVGRFDTLIDSWGMSSLVSQTIGIATEMDRAMGYEANAGGTSYIVDPNEMLGTLKIGSPLVSVTGNRNEPGSVGTVKWDDDGVAPSDFSIIENGVLHNMQTDREAAGWLKPAYDRAGMEMKSMGCSYSPDSMHPPGIHSANLTLQTQSEKNVTLHSLRDQIEEGIEFKLPGFSMDFQQSTGFGTGKAFEIKNGKRVASLRNAGILFRTSELWNSVEGLGGADSSRRYGLGSRKGQPPQQGYHSVTGVPALFKELTIIDKTRKG